MLPSVALSPPPLDWAAPERRFTNPGEYERLLMLANRVKAGRVLETGINTGITAAMLLANCPTITSYIGVDVPAGTDLPLAVQKTEVPDKAGKHVCDDPRVNIILRPRGSLDLVPGDIGEVDFAFIDGDHSIEGVVHDTLLAYKCVRKGGLVVWHDYHQLGTVDVPYVLDKFAERGHRIEHVAGTWLAFEEI